MTNDKLSQVREAVIRAVPEIVEMKDGCLFTRKMPPSYTQPVKECVGVKGHMIRCRTYQSGSGTNNSIHRDFVDKVIGRPIRIADVIATMGTDAMLNVDHHAARQGRSVLLVTSKNVGTHPRAEWDLLNDDLEKQSSDTIDFLFDILCKK